MGQYIYDRSILAILGLEEGRPSWYHSPLCYFSHSMEEG